MSAISPFRTNITVHFDIEEVILFPKTRTADETAQILLARSTYAVWGRNLPRISYEEHVRRNLLPGDSEIQNERRAIFLSHFVTRLKGGETIASSQMIQSVEEKYQKLIHKIGSDDFFPSFTQLFALLKKENDLGKKHTVVFRGTKNELDRVAHQMKQIHPEIAFSKAQMQALDPKKIREFFDRSRYWLVEDNKSHLFPYSYQTNRTYCYMNRRGTPLAPEQTKRRIVEVNPAQAALNETYFIEKLKEVQDIKEPVAPRKCTPCTRSVLIAVALVILSCLIPDSFLKSAR